MTQFLAILNVVYAFGSSTPSQPPAKKPVPVVAAAPVGYAAQSVFVPTPSPASKAASGPTSASAIIDQVQTFYQKTPHLTAKFRQTVMRSVFGKTSVSDGKVYLKKPGRMRWDYFNKRDPNRISKSQMSDGTTIWVVLIDNKQYFQQSLKKSALPVAVTFLTGKGNLKADFNAEIDRSGKWGTSGDLVLHLTPKKPSAQFNDLYLVVAPSNYRVKQSIVINSGGDVNKFQFFEPDTTKAVADTWFVFNPKAPAAKGFRRIEPDQTN